MGLILRYTNLRICTEDFKFIIQRVENYVRETYYLPFLAGKTDFFGDYRQLILGEKTLHSALFLHRSG